MDIEQMSKKYTLTIISISAAGLRYRSTGSIIANDLHDWKTVAKFHKYYANLLLFFSKIGQL